MHVCVHQKTILGLFDALYHIPVPGIGLFVEGDDQQPKLPDMTNNAGRMNIDIHFQMYSPPCMQPVNVSRTE